MNNQLFNLDFLFRSIVKNNRYFEKGWGKINVLQQVEEFLGRIPDRAKMQRDVHPLLKRTDISTVKHKECRGYSIIKGRFKSPLVDLLPDTLPPESQTSRFELVIPKSFERIECSQLKANSRPVCLHLAATFDTDTVFKRRQNMMAIPLAEKYGIASIIVENPFYGSRKPASQVRAYVHHVSDIFVMGCALIVECLALFNWCKDNGFGQLGISGTSIGGHMASFVQSGWEEPLAVIPCLSWTSASPVYTHGILNGTVAWDRLEKQLEDHPEYLNLFDSHLQDVLSEQRYTHQPPLSLRNNKRSDPSWQDEDERIGFNQLIFNDLEHSLERDSNSTYTHSKPSLRESLPGAAAPKRVLQQSLGGSMELLQRYTPFMKSEFRPSEQTLAYMSHLMDRYTHISHFHPPHPHSSVLYAVAKDDLYFPRLCYQTHPTDIWEGSEVRVVPGGHVSSVFLHQKRILEVIVEAFKRVQST